MGTIAYMSPEQARGASLTRDGCIFSFGCVLYEMATGVQPFRGESRNRRCEMRFCIALPSAPVRLNPDVPSELEAVIMKALEKERDTRYQSAAEIRSDLKRLKRDSESGRSAGPTAESGVKPAPKSTRGAKVACATIVVVGLAVGGWLFLLARRTR